MTWLSQSLMTGTWYLNTDTYISVQKMSTPQQMLEKGYFQGKTSDFFYLCRFRIIHGSVLKRNDYNLVLSSSLCIDLKQHERYENDW